MISLICRVKKIIQMNLFTKETHRLREQTIVIRGEEGRERGNNWEFGRLSEEKKAGRDYGGILCATLFLRPRVVRRFYSDFQPLSPELQVENHVRPCWGSVGIESGID